MPQVATDSSCAIGTGLHKLWNFSRGYTESTFVLCRFKSTEYPFGQLSSTLSAKPLHGWFCSLVNSSVVDKSVPSLNYRLCGHAEETIVHLLSACPVLAPTVYLHRYNLVAKGVHWHLMKVYSFSRTGQSWCSH